MAKEVLFRPVSAWQRPDCMVHNYSSKSRNKLPNEAHLEAYIGTVTIGCCDSEACKEDAKNLAQKIYDYSYSQ